MVLSLRGDYSVTGGKFLVLSFFRSCSRKIYYSLLGFFCGRRTSSLLFQDLPHLPFSFLVIQQSCRRHPPPDFLHSPTRERLVTTAHHQLVLSPGGHTQASCLGNKGPLPAPWSTTALGAGSVVTDPNHEEIVPLRVLLRSHITLRVPTTSTAPPVAETDPDGVPCLRSLLDVLSPSFDGRQRILGSTPVRSVVFPSSLTIPSPLPL